MTRKEALEYINNMWMSGETHDALETLIPEFGKTCSDKAIDYEEKYNEALEDMRVIYPNLKGDAKLAVEHAFPELAESEDERIIKLIRSLLENVRNVQSNTSLYKQYDDALAWLEKQKEEEGYEAIPVESTLEYKLGFKAGKESEKQKEGEKEVSALFDSTDSYNKGFRAGQEKALQELKEHIKEDKTQCYAYDAGYAAGFIVGKEQGWKERKAFEKQKEPHKRLRDKTPWIVTAKEELAHAEDRLQANLEELHRIRAEKEKQKEQEPIIQDVELNDAVYDYVRDHFIAGADFTPEYIKKLMENAFFAGVDYYLLKQESESCESDANVEKVIEDVIRVYGKTQGEWVGGYDVDTLIVNLRRAFNKKEQKPVEKPDLVAELKHHLATTPKEQLEKEWKELEHWNNIGPTVQEFLYGKPVEWSEEDEEMLEYIIGDVNDAKQLYKTQEAKDMADKEIAWLKSLRPQPKQEWTEEEKQKLNRIYSIIGWAMDEHAFSSCKKLIGDKEGVELQDFLRSIAKPEQQPSWKPSEEQMKALQNAVALTACDKELARLYNQLKKL